MVRSFRGGDFTLLLAAGLVAIALALAFGLLQDTTNRITAHTDGTESRTLKSDAIFPTGIQISDLTCIIGQPCKDSAIEFITGIYPRAGVMTPIAVMGGLVTPYVLICAAGFLAFRRTLGITRIIVAYGLAVTAAVLLAPLGIIAYLTASTGGAIDQLIITGGVPNVVALSISGLTAAMGGVWLFGTRANYRSRKQT